MMENKYLIGVWKTKGDWRITFGFGWVGKTGNKMYIEFEDRALLREIEEIPEEEEIFEIYYTETMVRLKRLNDGEAIGVGFLGNLDRRIRKIEGGVIERVDKAETAETERAEGEKEKQKVKKARRKNVEK